MTIEPPAISLRWNLRRKWHRVEGELIRQVLDMKLASRKNQQLLGLSVQGYYNKLRRHGFPVNPYHSSPCPACGQLSKAKAAGDAKGHGDPN